jgi:hypothetical protein
MLSPLLQRKGPLRPTLPTFGIAERRQLSGHTGRDANVHEESPRPKATTCYGFRALHCAPRRIISRIEKNISDLSK